MTALEPPATRRRHVVVLRHMARQFASTLGRDEKATLLATIDAYRRGRVPHATPIALVYAHARRHRVSFLLDQTYLDFHVKFGIVGMK